MSQPPKQILIEEFTMSRLTKINPHQATGKAKTLLDAVNGKLGLVPNMTRIMANSPAVLEGYLNFSGALAGGALSPKLREQIALVVAEANTCGYCLSAHTAIGKLVGLSPVEVESAREGVATDAKAGAALRFAKALVTERGFVNDGEIESLRRLGFSDGEIAEIIANVALNVFTNYFNHVAETDIDFPVVNPQSTRAA
jgi:uncharacterized peroxidase-related enzyme